MHQIMIHPKSVCVRIDNMWCQQTEANSLIKSEDLKDYLRGKLSQNVLYIQFSSVAPSCPTLCDPMDCSMLGLLSITNSQGLLKHMSIKLGMPSNHLLLCHPLLFLPSIFPSIRVFPNESVLHIRWPKYWSFSFSISPSNEYSGLISFRMDWLDLLAVQGTLKSLLQHHHSKVSILRHSAFFIVQLSHPYKSTGKFQHITLIKRFLIQVTL